MNLTHSDYKMINYAIEVAQDSPVLMKHGCVAYKNGRIIALYSDRQFSFNYLNRGVFDNFPMENTREYLLQLEYPDAIFKQVASIEVLSHYEAVSRFDGFINTKLFIEEIKTQKLKWNYVNKYWQDNSNRVIKSTQTLHPNLQRISVNYYYKY